MPKLLVVQHERNCPVDLFGRWWQEAGAELQIVYGPDEPLPSSLAEYDGLVVLGGGMSCKSEADHPHLGPTKDLIREACQLDVAFLGICLGHQLATLALGGDVGTKEIMSLGMTRVGLTDESGVDELFGGIEPGARAIQYNFDHATELPAGSIVLARAEDGHVQAVRFAKRAWGVQFHPECSTETFREWTTHKVTEKQPASPDGRRLAEVAAEVEASASELATTWRPLALRFLTVATVPATVAVTMAGTPGVSESLS